MNPVLGVLADKLEGVRRVTWIKLGFILAVLYLSVYIFSVSSRPSLEEVLPLTISELGTEIKLLENGHLEVAEKITLKSGGNSHGIVRRYRSKVLEPKLFRSGIDFIFSPEIIEQSGITGVRVGSADLPLNKGETEFTLIFKTTPILDITQSKETLIWNLTNRISTSIDKAWLRVSLPDYISRDSIMIDAVSRLSEVSLLKASTWGDPVTVIEDRTIAEISWESPSTAVVVATRKLAPGEDIQVTLQAAPLTFKVISGT